MIASVVSLSKTGTMFFILSTTFSLVILVGLALQAMPVLRLIRTIGQPSPEPLEDRECPPVAILLSLRGGDPFLSDCLKKLLQQDYPDYELVIALDHERDPAARYVDQVIDDLKPANLTKKIITRREANCTLLNNNYALLVEELDDRFEIVVLVAVTVLDVVVRVVLDTVVLVAVSLVDVTVLVVPVAVFHFSWLFCCLHPLAPFQHQQQHCCDRRSQITISACI